MKKPITFKGKPFESTAALARHYGISYKTLHARLQSGWTLERAVDEPIGTLVTFRGKPFKSDSALARHYGISPSNLHSRLAMGWPLEQALGLETRPKQTRNAAIKVEFGGETFESMTDLAAHYGVKAPTFCVRRKAGWTLEQALGVEPRPKRTGSTAIKVTYNGKTFDSMIDMANHYDVKDQTLHNRLKRGWPLDLALSLPPQQEQADSVEVDCDGNSFPTIVDFAMHYGKEVTITGQRLRYGWTPEQAVDLEPPPPKYRDENGNARDHLYLNPQIIDGSVVPSTELGCYRLYVIRNQRSGKEYVGLTTGSLTDRLGSHWGDATRGRDSKLHNAMRKTLREGSKDDFIITQIRNDAKDYRELQEQEIQEIADRDTIASGYNTAQGGVIGGDTAKITTIDGKVFPSQSAAAMHYNVPVGRFEGRLKLRWTLEQAVGLDDPPKNQTGTKWMFKGNEQTLVRPDDIDEKLAQGWLFGMSTEARRNMAKAKADRK